jgi:uncharacterized membrane protein
MLRMNPRTEEVGMANLASTHEYSERDPGMDIEATPGERLLTMVGGGALAWYGLTRRSLLGLATAAIGGYAVYRSAIGHAPVREGLSLVMSPASEPVVVEQTITINRSPEEVYAFFRDPENLVRVMQSVESVQVQDEGWFRWVAEPIPGIEIVWHEGIVEDRPNERIVWKVAPDDGIDGSASLTLKPAPGERGVETKLRFEILPPGGALGATVVGMFDSIAEKRLKTYLRHAKQLLETGEIAMVEGQASGRADAEPAC